MCPLGEANYQLDISILLHALVIEIEVRLSDATY